MDMNTVEVAITVTVNGLTITKDASGSSTNNPYRLGESIASAVLSEMNNELTDPRRAWDSQRRRGN